MQNNHDPLTVALLRLLIFAGAAILFLRAVLSRCPLTARDAR